MGSDEWGESRAGRFMRGLLLVPRAACVSLPSPAGLPTADQGDVMLPLKILQFVKGRLGEETFLFELMDTLRETMERRA